MTEPVEKHSLAESVLLHLLPGALVAAATFGLAWLFRGRGVPALFFLQLAVPLAMLPSMYALMRREARKRGIASVRGLVVSEARRPALEHLVAIPLIVVFAALVLTLFGKFVHPAVKEALFPWLPAYLDVGDVYLNAAAYSPAWRKIVWFSGLVLTGVVGPVAEELYFRGFLLPRIRGRLVGPLLLGALLFSAYHFFSPWMLPGRVIALLPLIYLVLARKNLRAAIWAHCLLNLLGDSVSTIPLVFG